MSGNEHEDDFFGGAGGGLQFMGVLNALRTGDPMLDMIIAMCFPALIRFVFEGFQRLLNSFRLFDLKLNDDHERRIIHKSSLNGYGGRETDEDSQNTILIKAINLYLHHQVKLRLKEAHVDLTSTEDKNASVGRSRYNYYYDSPDDDDDDEDSKTVVGALSKYRIVQKPPPNQWHNLGDHGEGKFSAPVRLQIEIDHVERNDGNGRSTTTQTEITHSYHFKSPSGQAIDVFIQKAYQWYVDELRKQNDNARYFYELKANDSLSSLGRGNGNDEDGNGSSAGSRVCYKRYRLSDEKTFASLFFRQKESVLKLLNHFQAKTGKYQIQGYPHKLGLLLHGAPGSGKSSLLCLLCDVPARLYLILLNFNFRFFSSVDSKSTSHNDDLARQPEG